MLRLFTYYALHSFRNQLRKLFKTWVIIFVLVFVLAGLVVGALDAFTSDDEDDVTVEEPVTDSEDGDPGLTDTLGLTPAGMVELVVGGLSLLLLVISAISADKSGSAIFLPADVNLLFASPLAPQTVLMFRVMTQLGVSLLAGAYILCQIPNLVGNMGLGIWCALSVALAWGLSSAVGTLIQILLYTVASTRPKLKKLIRPTVYAVLVLAAGGYMLSVREHGGYIQALTPYFNSNVSRLIPFWGWIKAMCAFACEDRFLPALGCLAATLIGGGLLAFLIWHVKADFYEDALYRSQETAELMASTSSEKTVIRRKKDRSEKLRRDGFDRGRGANVFFFKAMYNRFRFAYLRVFTKTNLLYLAAALAVCLIAPDSLGLIPAGLTLCVLVFFRTLGNPLEQDMVCDFFVTVPESGFSKLSWSALGGAADCLMDVLPALVLASILTGSSPLDLLLWLPITVSVDLYGTVVGAFIYLSVPASVGRMVKQVIQVLFIYFGLVPAGVIAAVLLIMGLPAPALLIPAALNLVLSAVFLGLSSLFVGP